MWMVEACCDKAFAIWNENILIAPFSLNPIPKIHADGAGGLMSLFFAFPACQIQVSGDLQPYVV